MSWALPRRRNRAPATAPRFYMLTLPRIIAHRGASGDAPENTIAAFRAAAAADILCWRRQVLTDLRASGVLTLDCFPEHLTAPLINEYIRIKARNLL